MSDGSAPGSQATHLPSKEKCGFYGVNLCSFALFLKVHLQSVRNVLLLLFFVTCNL